MNGMLFAPISRILIVVHHNTYTFTVQTTAASSHIVLRNSTLPHQRVTAIMLVTQRHFFFPFPFRPTPHQNSILNPWHHLHYIVLSVFYRQTHTPAHCHTSYSSFRRWSITKWFVILQSTTTAGRTSSHFVQPSRSVSAITSTYSCTISITIVGKY